MKKSLWLGSVLAGLTVFVWGFLSWLVLPIHNAAFLQFKNEPVVTAAIAANAQEPGVYMLPNPHVDADSFPAEVRKLREEAAMKQWQNGPTMLAVVRTGGAPPMWRGMLIGLLNQIAGAVLIGFLLSKTGGLGYWGKVGFVVLVGVTAGVLSLIPEWNWWGFSTVYLAGMFVDYVVGWFFGGLVLAKFS